MGWDTEFFGQGAPLAILVWGDSRPFLVVSESREHHLSECVRAPRRAKSAPRCCFKGTIVHVPSVFPSAGFLSRAVFLCTRGLAWPIKSDWRLLVLSADLAHHRKFLFQLIQ